MTILERFFSAIFKRVALVHFFPVID